MTALPKPATPVHSIFRLLLLVTLALFTDGAQSQASPQPNQLADLLALYNAHAELPLPALNSADLRELSKGETVLLRDRTPLAADDEEGDDQIRATGFKLFAKPRRQIWVSTLYKDPEAAGGLKEHIFSMGERGGYTLYQYLELPWPIRDRHWTIEVSKYARLAEQTEQRVWEHGWRLAPTGKKLAQQIVDENIIPSISRKEMDRAIYLPVNRGGWIAIEVDAKHTLLIAHTTTVMSGWIPNRFVAVYTTRTLDKMIRAIDDYADQVTLQYDHRRFPVFTGDGVLIQRGCVAEKLDC